MLVCVKNSDVWKSNDVACSFFHYLLPHPLRIPTFLRPEADTHSNSEALPVSVVAVSFDVSSQTGISSPSQKLLHRLRQTFCSFWKQEALRTPFILTSSRPVHKRAKRVCVVVFFIVFCHSFSDIYNTLCRRKRSFAMAKELLSLFLCISVFRTSVSATGG